MNLEQQKYIKENRTKESMLTMAKCLGISYSTVRNYMILKNLQVSQETFKKFNKACNGASKACKEVTDAMLALKKSNLIKHKSRYHS
jgi:hypothetical protein